MIDEQHFAVKFESIRVILVVLAVTRPRTSRHQANNPSRQVLYLEVSNDIEGASPTDQS